MQSIDFTVTDSATTPARDGTDQTFDVDIISGLRPIHNYDRHYSSAMDHLSGQGTKISKHSIYEVTLTEPKTKIPSITELMDSLADFQIATFNFGDCDHVEETVNFVMLGNNYSPDLVGLTHISFNIQIKLQP